jgi:U4/U6 small nuclear ribonucleoprotein PRP3
LSIFEFNLPKAFSYSPRVKTLSDPAHRFKVRKNAEQLNLTGVCIFNPNFSMIYVEGAASLLRKYKRLLLHRLNWTEAARPRGADDVELEEDGVADASSAGQEASEQATEGGPTVSLEDNRCDLLWEGMILERAFQNFKPRSCPTDNSAREALGPKLASRWDSAKNWKPEDEELY